MISAENGGGLMEGGWSLVLCFIPSLYFSCSNNFTNQCLIVSSEFSFLLLTGLCDFYGLVVNLFQLCSKWLWNAHSNGQPGSSKPSSHRLGSLSQGYGTDSSDLRSEALLLSPGRGVTSGRSSAAVVDQAVPSVLQTFLFILLRCSFLGTAHSDESDEVLELKVKNITCCNILLCFVEETVYLIILLEISARIEKHDIDTVPHAPDSCSKACAGECPACDAEGVSDS